MEQKRLYGQFFTVSNPFELNVFMQWFKGIEGIENETILEPFAGANNIVELIQSVTYWEYSKWACFDIEPSVNNVVPDVIVTQRDTIKDFPVGYRVAITNPPYLAKNSATRRGLAYVGGIYDDVYKKCLELMLDNCEYVAAIIPESFITSGLFHDRLETVISLTCRMFSDTDCPVCLALFSPEKNNANFSIYDRDRPIGTYNELKCFLFDSEYKISAWKMNDKDGQIGVSCIDNTTEPSIGFVRGDEINPSDIKVSSRSKTRISGLPDTVDRDAFISRCNELLNEYRKATCDVFMTSFKGLRKDGKYRRRLDFKTIQHIMSTVLEEIENE